MGSSDIYKGESHMKKTLILTMMLATLIPGYGEVEGGWTWNELIWDEVGDIENKEFRKDFTAGTNDKLTIELGTDGDEVDLGGISLWNNVICEQGDEDNKHGAINPNAVVDDADAAVKTYTYGWLQLADDATVRLSKQGNLPTNKPYAKYTSVGTLGLGANATLTLEERQLEITGLPYVSLGAGAEVVLAARDTTLDNSSGGVLSMGAVSVSGADAVVVKGVNGGEGRITNTSDAVAELGGKNAVNVEYCDVNITVRGSQRSTTIVAKLGNAAINNQTKGGEIILTGGRVGETTAVTQINTGVNDENGGGVTLLHRGAEAQEMDSIYIGNKLKVTTRQGEADSASGLIRMKAYDAKMAETLDGVLMEADYGLSSFAYSVLDSDLELGTGKANEAVLFAPQLELASYGATDMAAGLGLDMAGNDVTLKSGVLMMSYLFSQAPKVLSEYLLFSNVDSLILGDDEYDGIYFDYTDGVAAAEYFSSDYEDAPWWYSSIEALQTDGNGDAYGWFLEYRAAEETANVGNVYLAYRPGAEIVPEPASVTLSLLALAGWVARRRRTR